jgi:thioredoxin 1
MEAAHAAITLTDDNFAQEVKQFPGVVLVDFWAAWCGPCLQMAPRIEELAQEYAGNNNVKVAKLDVDANIATAQEYGVMSLPTFLVYVNGQDVASIIGAGPKENLKNAIEQALQHAKTAATATA